MVNEIQWIIYKCQKFNDRNNNIVNMNNGIQPHIYWFKELLTIQGDWCYICAWKWHVNYGFSVFINLMIYGGLSVDKVSAKDSLSCIESIFNIKWPIWAIYFSRNAVLANCRKNRKNSTVCKVLNYSTHSKFCKFFMGFQRCCVWPNHSSFSYQWIPSRSPKSTLHKDICHVSLQMLFIQPVWCQIQFDIYSYHA